MWFAFPVGYERISVERQEFAPEFTDDKGRHYFRAPNHFAPMILAIKGFAQAEPPTDLADLPQADPLRDGAISQLTKENEALKLENTNTRSDIVAATAQIKALVNDKTMLEAELLQAKAKIVELEEELEDKPLAEVAKAPKAK